MPFVATAVAQAMRWYDPDKIGASRMAIGNAIRLMCRAAKSREGDHFAIAVGLASRDRRLRAGDPRLGARRSHPRRASGWGAGSTISASDSAKLVPPAAKDSYEDEAYRMLELKQRKVKRDLFDE